MLADDKLEASLGVQPPQRRTCIRREGLQVCRDVGLSRLVREQLTHACEPRLLHIFRVRHAGRRADALKRVRAVQHAQRRLCGELGVRLGPADRLDALDRPANGAFALWSTCASKADVDDVDGDMTEQMA